MPDLLNSITKYAAHFVHRYGNLMPGLFYMGNLITGQVDFSWQFVQSNKKKLLGELPEIKQEKSMWSMSLLLSVARKKNWKLMVKQHLIHVCERESHPITKIS